MIVFPECLNPSSFACVAVGYDGLGRVAVDPGAGGFRDCQVEVDECFWAHVSRGYLWEVGGEVAPEGVGGFCCGLGESRVLDLHDMAVSFASMTHHVLQIGSVMRDPRLQPLNLSLWSMSLISLESGSIANCTPSELRSERLWTSMTPTIATRA